jgi:hypothetical protein
MPNESDEEKEDGAIPVSTPPLELKNIAYSKISRELSDTDLSNPSISRLLIAQIDSLEQDKSSLKVYETEYHKKDKELAKYIIKSNKNIAFEILSQFSLTLGGGLLSVSTLDFSNPVIINNYIFLIFGGLLIIGSLISFWRKS